MNRRHFGKAAGLSLAAVTAKGDGVSSRPILPGIWRLRFGHPEPLRPVGARRYQPAVQGLSHLPDVANPPIALAQIAGSVSKRGYEVRIPLQPGEMVYGLGLTFQSFYSGG